jgi:probable phosphoglycerate mutase
VLLIRHGETEWSRDRRHTGRTDLPLLPDGERDVRRLAPVLAGEHLDLVLTSPLQRARRTAELAGLAGAATDDDLREWDYGEYEGITTPEIRETRPGWDLWRDGCPGGEDAAAVGARADRVIDRVIDEDPDTAVLVAHSHLLRVLAARWMELDPSAGGRLVLGTAALCELGLERERRVVVRWNDTHHLGHP